MLKVINGDCYEVIKTITRPIQCIFADPPDNIDLKYGEYKDKWSIDDYLYFCRTWIQQFIENAPIVWLSFNSRWLLQFADIVNKVVNLDDIEFKPCIQVFTFGQNQQKDLSNCNRPLWRFRRYDAPVYPDQVRLASWRQLNGDKRADPRGKVPSDVFDFPRVTGNSKQRRAWCPTQLNEGLVQRCVEFSTRPGELVVDPFAGSGTTLRVCRATKRDCITTDVDKGYCVHIAQENDLKQINDVTWEG